MPPPAISGEIRRAAMKRLALLAAPVLLLLSISFLLLRPSSPPLLLFAQTPSADHDRRRLSVYVADLPRALNHGLLDLYWSLPAADARIPASSDPDHPPPRGHPPYPANPLIRQYSAEYWLLASLLRIPASNAVVRVVADWRDADVVFVPFFATLSTEMELGWGATKGAFRRKEGNGDYQRQREVVDYQSHTEAHDWAAIRMQGADATSGRRAGMASPDDMAELAQETVEEAEVLRRLGTGEKAGLTGEEATRRLRIHGPNVVSRSHHEDSMLGEFLMTIFSIWGWHHVFPNYLNMVCVILNSMSWVTVLTAVVSLAIASADQRSYMLAASIFVLATSLIACFTAKLVAEYVNAPLEAKAFTPLEVSCSGNDASPTSTRGCGDGDIDTRLWWRQRHRHGAAAVTTSTLGCSGDDDIMDGDPLFVASKLLGRRRHR